MSAGFHVHSVGMIVKRGTEVRIEIEPRYAPAMMGLEQFSHIQVLYWFHENDHRDRRDTLQVHPRGERQNPLTGVFATHAPLRPNLVALCICRVLRVRDQIIHIDAIDAFDGSPVIDIKCYIPGSEPAGADVTVPAWV